MSQVARRHNANTYLAFTWLRNPRFAPDEASQETSTFLPVEVVGERRGVVPGAPAVESCIEIDVAGGYRLRIIGPYHPDTLARLIRGLSA